MAKKTVTKRGHQGKRSTINGLSVEDRQFFDVYISDANFNGTRAYMMVHPHIPPASARSRASEIMARIRPVIDRWLDEIGLSDTALKTKLAQLLNAKETKFFVNEGEVVSREEVEALHIQTKALELAMKHKGMLSDKSAREVDQIDRLIELELRKLGIMENMADTGQDPAPEEVAKKDQADQA